MAEGNAASRLSRMLGRPRSPEAPMRRELCHLPPGGLVAPGVWELVFSHPLGTLHGGVPLTHPDASGELLEPWGGSRDQVFLDLETTGLAGGTGTYAFLAGVGRVEGEAFVVRQLFLLSPAAEGAWFCALEERAAGGRFVTYNGRTFDLPLLRTRAVMTGHTPLRERCHLDLLLLARRLWRDDLAGCALGDVERGVVGFSRTEEDIPGYLIPEIYATFLRSGDADPLQGVFLHNRWDILSLAAAQLRAADVVGGTGGSPAERLRAGRLWAQQGHVSRAEAFWRAIFGEGDEPGVRGEAAYLLGLSAKRRGCWGDALRWFEVAGERGGHVLEALTEAAKVAEHRLRNPARALAATDRALAVLLERRPWMARHEGTRWRNDLTHRRDRLVRRMG